MTHNIQTGTLLAYLAEGESDPETKQALLESPELQAELNELRQIDICLRQELSNASLFDTQDLIDVVTGQATENQRFIVATQIRLNPAIKEEMETLIAEYTQLIADG